MSVLLPPLLSVGCSLCSLLLPPLPGLGSLPPLLSFNLFVLGLLGVGLLLPLLAKDLGVVSLPLILSVEGACAACVRSSFHLSLVLARSLASARSARHRFVIRHHHWVVRTRSVVKLQEPVGLLDLGDGHIVRGLPRSPCLGDHVCPPHTHHPGYGREGDQRCRDTGQELI